LADTPPAVGMPARESVVTAMSFTLPTATVSTRLTAAAGQTYQILRTTEVDEYDPPVAPEAVGAFAAHPAGRVARRSDSFRGSKRKAAKLAIADAPIEAFGDLPSFIASLTPDRQMRSRRPPISDGPRSNRVDEEKRNIHVRAFLYAASREDDNDYHLIIGSDRSAGPLQCMTMELSGLPRSRNRSFVRLKAARNAYKAFFGTNLPGTSYDFYDPPIPVEIEGSLFWDANHATGTRPGPQSLKSRMPTVWEVHPISTITFIP
jgi:hypothetical protein